MTPKKITSLSSVREKGKVGGARPGAGRPKGEPTTVVRLPEKLVKKLGKIKKQFDLETGKIVIDLRKTRLIDLNGTLDIPNAVDLPEGPVVFVADLEKLGFKVLR